MKGIILLNSVYKKRNMFEDSFFDLYKENFGELLSYFNEPAVVVDLKRELLIIGFNEQFCRLIEKKKPEMIHQHLLTFFTNDSRSLIGNNFNGTDSQDDILEGVLDINKKTRVPVEIRIQPLHGQESGLFLVTFRNISVFRKVLQDLRNHQGWLERAETIASIGYWEYDLKTNKMWGSRGARSIYGLDEKEITLNDIQEIPLSEYREDLDMALLNLINKGEKYDKEFEIFNLKGKRVFVHSMAEYDCFEKKVYGIIQDITFKKKFEKELIDAKNKAEESDRLKSAFLSNMSHEIRTPMNGILGFSKLMLQPEVTNETRAEYSEIIDNCCNKLLDIIDNILDISKVETGQVKIEKSLTDVVQVLKEIDENYREIIRKKGLELIICYPEAGRSHVYTDKEKIKQIFRNLLDNSIRFTPSGCIETGCKITGETAEFYVKDTGIGIALHHHEIIFEPFRQAEINTSAEYGGFGTGLTIVREYVKILGGVVKIESEVGKGTLVKFTHPIGAEIRDIKSNNNMKSLSCLVVEDFEINYLYIKAILTPKGIDVVWAKNGMEAIQHVKSNKKTDFVLMDIRLPDMDGYDVTRTIKGLYPHLPVIAQTANAAGYEKEKAFMAGCDDYITKPIYKEELLEKIGNFITY